MYLRFGDVEHADPMAELVAFKQTRSVQKFLGKFDELLNQVELTEEHSISSFLANLNPEIEV